MEKNTKILTVIIALLILLNLTIVGTILYNRNINYSTQYDKETIIPSNHLGRFFKKELNLSNTQHKAFREIRRQYHKASDNVLEKMKKNRNDLLAELGKEESNIMVLNKLSQDLGYLHTELKNLTIKYYLDMEKICNKKQRTKLFQLFTTIVNSNDIILMPEEKNYKK